MTAPTVTPQPVAWMRVQKITAARDMVELSQTPWPNHPPSITETPLFTREQTVAEVVARIRATMCDCSGKFIADAFESGEWSAS